MLKTVKNTHFRMIKCFLILGVFKGKVRAKVLYPHQPTKNLSTTKINILKLIHKFINSLCITTKHLCCLALLLACCARGSYHRAPTHYTRHKTSDITKDYIYINIIYHMTIKSRLIERQSLIRLYHATSHRITHENGFYIPLI